MRLAAIMMFVGLAGCLGSSDLVGEEAPPPNADPLAGCATNCHGTDASNAPPRSLSGGTETTAVAVGAHEAHGKAAPEWHRKVECADCHVVPDRVDAPGHIDGDGKAEVVFSMNAGGTSSTWGGTTCTTGCHGKAAWGGTSPTPIWTRVDGKQAECGSCHGAPPPSPHPAGSNCASCHPTMEENSLAFRDPTRHIDGKVDMTTPGATGGCTTCHGSATNAAPPKDLKGNTTATTPTVGAHQAHLKASTWHRAVVCSSCHVVPTEQTSPGHLDGDNIAEIKFDTLNPAGTFTKANSTCATMYCHGNGRGNTGTIAFTAAGPLACTACHQTNGTGMSGRHRKHIDDENMKCSQCHKDVVSSTMTILKADLHINGAHEVKMDNGTWNPATRSCSNTGCHNTKRW